MRWLDLALAATALVVVVNVLAVLVLAGASRVRADLHVRSHGGEARGRQ
jgi:hypothetical protein